MTWAQDTVAELIAAAEQEARRITDRAHARAEAHIHQVRVRLTRAVTTAGTGLRRKRADLAELIERLDRGGRQPSWPTATAEADQAAGRRPAPGRAHRPARPPPRPQEQHERAERRVAEAEAGAQAVREQVAEQLGESQRELHQLRRTARAETAELIARARAEAEEMRAEALQHADRRPGRGGRADRRRNAIAAELGQLSGVIEALAVEEGRPAARTAEPNRGRCRNAGAPNSRPQPNRP